MHAPVMHARDIRAGDALPVRNTRAPDAHAADAHAPAQSLGHKIDIPLASNSSAVVSDTVANDSSEKEEVTFLSFSQDSPKAIPTKPAPFDQEWASILEAWRHACEAVGYRFRTLPPTSSVGKLARARLRESSLSTVTGVIAWFATSEHKTAKGLREGGYRLQTLLRPANFPRYAELAEAEEEEGPWSGAPTPALHPGAAVVVKASDVDAEAYAAAVDQARAMFGTDGDDDDSEIPF